MMNLERSELIEIYEQIQFGNYTQASQLIAAAKKSDKKMTAKEKVQNKLLHCIVLLNKGYYKRCSKAALNLYKKGLKDNDFILSLEATSLLVSALEFYSDLTEISSWIVKGEEIYNLLKEGNLDKMRSILARFL
ncbi:MAG: hypothetical protein ACTSSH_07845, partial [Candidatus Heimdallarchaeota archaeon]